MIQGTPPATWGCHGNNKWQEYKQDAVDSLNTNKVSDINRFKEIMKDLKEAITEVASGLTSEFK